MGDIINLNKARKAKARDEKKATAEQNRTVFGRTRAEKDLSRAEREKQDRDLSGHKRDPDAT